MRALAELHCPVAAHLGRPVVRLDSMSFAMERMPARLNPIAARLVPLTALLERPPARLDSLPTHLGRKPSGHSRETTRLENLKCCLHSYTPKDYLPRGINCLCARLDCLTARSPASPCRPHGTQFRTPLAPARPPSLL
jgi:hypothetical protein